MTGVLGRVLRVIGLALLLPVLAGCDQILMRKPGRKELEGRYFLAKASAKWLVTAKRYDHIPESVITLGPGPNLVVENLPDCAIDGFGAAHGRFLSGKGEWELEKASIGYGLNFDVGEGGSLPHGHYAGPWVTLRRRVAPHELEITVGDPDSRETVRYVKARAGWSDAGTMTGTRLAK